MPEIFRSRDCIVFVKDQAYTVVVSSAMATAGWPGAQGVQWAGATQDEFLVTYARGKSSGLLVWGSDEAGDDFTAMTRNQPYWRFATMLSGAALLTTSTYERYTLASRLAGPLVPIAYSLNQPLYFSLRGYWTNEDELTGSGDVTAPSTVAGYVAQLPKASNRNFLGVQTQL